MNFLEIFMGVTLTVLLWSPCQAWEEEDQQIDQGFLDPATKVGDFRGPLEQVWGIMQRIRSDEGSDVDVPVKETYKDAILRPLPYLSSRSHTGWRLRPMEGWKQKRYMGMEIPEYITKNDGSRVETQQRGTKQKMLNSG